MENKVIEPTKPKKVRTPKEPKEPKAKKEKEVEVKWMDLYFVLSDASDKFMRSILSREDVADDVKDTLRGVMAMREAKDLFYAEAEFLTKDRALFWADKLKEWASNKI